jgi:hypothetical protein
MWTTLIPTAIAAAIFVSVVNLASEINKIREAPAALRVAERDVMEQSPVGASLVARHTRFIRNPLLLERSGRQGRKGT